MKTDHKPETIGDLIKALSSDEFEMGDEIQVLDNGVLMCRRHLIGKVKLTGGVQLPLSENN